jgi:hypothetical protein
LVKSTLVKRHCFREVFVNSSPLLVALREQIVPPGVLQVGSAPIPFGGLRRIWPAQKAIVGEGTDIARGLPVSRLGCPCVPSQGLSAIYRNTVPFVITQANSFQSGGVTAFRRPLEETDRKSS